MWTILSSEQNLAALGNISIVVSQVCNEKASLENRDTLKELINAAFIFADLIFANRGLNLKVFCGTNFCGCLKSKKICDINFCG